MSLGFILFVFRFRIWITGFGPTLRLFGHLVCLRFLDCLSGDDCSGCYV
uniref:Uncharacterized protein n=1 Tax=Rhizophora mucronata TaxID=61149 RepID=A0A2P2QSK1_RHIMU